MVVRHLLRSDEVQTIEAAIHSKLGVSLDGNEYEVEILQGERLHPIYVDGSPLALYLGLDSDGNDDGFLTFDSREEPERFLTIAGAREYAPTRKVVAVDTGTLSSILHGSNVMRPGIEEACSAIESDDLVVVKEAGGKPWMIGRALTDGDDMLGETGKVVESLHHLGDDLY